ncbi:MAG: hypothetical protein WC314_05080 [Vulcanimicrobiota bacterium]
MLGVLLLALILAGCTLSHPLVGRWKTQSSDGQESVLWFKSDGTFEAIAKGENLPGKWIFHEENEPTQLELVFEEARTVRTIAKLTGDELQIEPREEGTEMPTSFTAQVQKYQRQ